MSTTRSLLATFLVPLTISAAEAGLVLSVASVQTNEAAGEVSLNLFIHDTMSPPALINTVDLAIAIGDGGAVLDGSDAIEILDLDFSTGVFALNSDTNYGAVAAPGFGQGAVVRGVQSSAGVTLSSTPQQLAVLRLGNLVAGEYEIDLNARGLTTIGRSGVGPLAFDAPPMTTTLNVTAVPEPGAGCLLSVVAGCFALRQLVRRHVCAAFSGMQRTLQWTKRSAK